MFMNPTVFDDTRPCWNPPLVLENLGNIYACGGDNEKKRSQKQKKEWMRYRQKLIKTLCHEKIIFFQIHGIYRLKLCT